jgi:hypothetical protein
MTEIISEGQNFNIMDVIYGFLGASALNFGIGWVLDTCVYSILIFYKYGLDYASHIPLTDLTLFPILFIGGWVALAIANFLFKKIKNSNAKLIFLIVGIICGLYGGITGIIAMSKIL